MGAPQYDQTCMTWGQFKTAVDAMISEAGHTSEIPVDQIRFHDCAQNDLQMDVRVSDGRSYATIFNE